MKEIIELSQKLIRIPSLSADQKKVKQCFKIIRENLKRDFFFQKIKSGIYESWIISKHKIKKFDIFLYGHLDVVAANDKDFVPKIKFGKLYGRGSFDMKASVAVLTEVLKNLKNSKLKVALVLVPDEEIGGFNGLNAVLKAGYRAKVAIVPDGGFGRSFVINEKGIVFYRLSCRGNGGHGSRPWEGQNQIVKLFKVYEKLLQDLKVNNRKLNSGLTVNLGKMYGGDKVNQIPTWAQIELDCRFLNVKDKVKLEKYIKNLKKQKIKIEKMVEGEVFSVDKNNCFLKLFKKFAEKNFKKKFKFSWQCGGSDARFLSRYKIPVINFQPLGGNNHKKNEWLDLESLDKFKSTLKEFLNYCDFHHEELFA